MHSTVKERVREFILYKKISTRAFERLVGLSYGYINAMRVSMQPDKVSNIASQFPELNTGWLMTGEGEMLKNSDSQTSEVVSRIEERLLAIIESQQRTIDTVTRTVEQLTKKIDAHPAAPADNAAAV